MPIFEASQGILIQQSVSDSSESLCFEKKKFLVENKIPTYSSVFFFAVLLSVRDHMTDSNSEYLQVS